jgi:16S rRNA (guanine966-N2)-methyltransferase
MRIVGGRHKGRRLTAPEGRDTRPTADRAREALFNILAHSAAVALEGATVADCFAGAGGLGLEALSRGAAHVTFIDSGAPALAAIRANIALLKEQATTTILKADATRLPAAAHPCDLVLLDPPYHGDLTLPCLAGLAARGWLAQDALVVVEVAAAESFATPDGFSELDRRTYGAAKFIFLKAPAP